MARRTPHSMLSQFCTWFALGEPAGASPRYPAISGGMLLSGWNMTHQLLLISSGARHSWYAFLIQNRSSNQLSGDVWSTSTRRLLSR